MRDAPLSLPQREQHWKEGLIMILWYRKSFLASLVSIFSCVTVIAAIESIRDGSLDCGSGAMLIVLGVAGIILGWIINERKKNRKR